LQSFSYYPTLLKVSQVSDTTLLIILSPVPFYALSISRK